VTKGALVFSLEFSFDQNFKGWFLILWVSNKPNPEKSMLVNLLQQLIPLSKAVLI